MVQDHQKEGEYNATPNVIDKNWKALIKPNKLDIKIVMTRLLPK